MIAVRELHYRYSGSADPAVRNISFEIEKGQIFGFLGPSGAGKSTTQRILMGLLRDYQGKVEVLGKEAKGWGSEYYERIGVCFEFPNHYLKLTALENLQLFGSLYKSTDVDYVGLLESVGLVEDANKRVGAFSKGMQIRLNFARSILHSPEVLFLDEPTAGLDPGNARRVKDLVLGLREKGTTIFLTTHDMSVADELCDRVAFLVDGSIVREDAPRALKLDFGRKVVRLEHRADGSRQQAEFPLDGLGDNADFLALLHTGEIETIHTEEATLEDIFLRVTGRSLQ